VFFMVWARGQSRVPSARPKQGAPDGPTLNPTSRTNPVLLSLIYAPFRSDPDTVKGAKSVLPHLAQSQDQRKAGKALEPCAQLEFQSAV
jgi:hypothetical protein